MGRRIVSLFRIFPLQIAALGLAAWSLGGCSSTDMQPSGTTNLAGTWKGTLTHLNGSGVAVNSSVTWVATQNSTNVTGPVTVVPAGNVIPVAGTIAGTISGTQVMLTMTAPEGAFVALGGPQACSFTGTSTATATTTTISGSMFETFSAACVGTVAGSSTQTETLSLTKS